MKRTKSSFWAMVGVMSLMLLSGQHVAQADECKGAVDGRTYLDMLGYICTTNKCHWAFSGPWEEEPPVEGCTNDDHPEGCYWTCDKMTINSYGAQELACLVKENKIDIDFFKQVYGKNNCDFNAAEAIAEQVQTDVTPDPKRSGQTVKGHSSRGAAVLSNERTGGSAAAM